LVNDGIKILIRVNVFVVILEKNRSVGFQEW
jgi:hypothetical protein